MIEQTETRPGLREAAALLLTLGEEPAAEVLKNLSARDVQRIGSAMASIGPMSRAELQRTLTLFIEETDAQASVGVGAEDYVRSVLTNALGVDKASGLLDRILLGQASKGLETLKWMDARSVSDHLRNEHPQTIAVILSYLEPEQAGEVLMRLSETMRADILARIAVLEGVQPAALSRLDEIIESQLSGGTSARTTSLGGPKAAANILNTLEQSHESAILGEIRAADEPLAIKIEELIFTFEDLLEIDDRGMQELLRNIKSETLVKALKVAEEGIRQKFMKNMSQRAAQMLQDDIEAAPPIKVSEVEGAQKEILASVRQMADEGKIALGSGGDTYV